MKRLKPFTLLILFHILVLLTVVGLLLRQKGKSGFDKEQIVVLPVEGIISMEKGSLGRGMTVDSLVETINDLREKENVKALVLRINSPGGSVGAVQEIYHALIKFRSKGKIVVSSFGDISASGGYYIACAGDKILSQPGTLTGSIGVLMQLPNVQGLLGKLGITMQTIKSGRMKDSGSPFRQMSNEEREYFTKIIMDAYNQFFTAVKNGRRLDGNKLEPLADGRIFSGRMAHSAKLVDELGGLEEAIGMAKKLTGLVDKNPQIVFRKDKISLGRLLDLFSKNPLQKLESAASAGPSLMYLFQ